MSFPSKRGGKLRETPGRKRESHQDFTLITAVRCRKDTQNLDRIESNPIQSGDLTGKMSAHKNKNDIQKSIQKFVSVRKLVGRKANGREKIHPRARRVGGQANCFIIENNIIVTHESR